MIMNCIGLKKGHPLAPVRLKKSIICHNTTAYAVIQRHRRWPDERVCIVDCSAVA